MVDRTIGFEITADAQPAVSALKDVERQSNDTLAALKNFAGSTAVTVLQKSIDAVKASVDKLVISIQEMQDWVVRVSQKYARLGAIGIGIFGVMANEARQLGDELAKQARNVGFTTDGFQTLNYVFQIGGQNADALFKAVGQLQYAIVQASYGLTTYTRLFDDLGLEYQEIAKLTPEAQLREVLDALRDLESQTQKSGIAIQLFGRAGRRLIATLGDSDGSVRSLEADLRSLGGVASEDALNAMEQLNDTIATFKQIAVVQIAEGLSQIVQQFGDVRVFAEGFALSVRKISEAMVTLGRIIYENIDLIRGASLYFTLRPLIGAIFKFGAGIAGLFAIFSKLAVVIRLFSVGVAALPGPIANMVGSITQTVLGFNAVTVASAGANSGMAALAASAVRTRIALVGLAAALVPVVGTILTVVSIKSLSQALGDATDVTLDFNEQLAQAGIHSKELNLEFASFVDIAVAGNDAVKETIRELVNANVELGQFNRDSQKDIARTTQQIKDLGRLRVTQTKEIAELEEYILGLQTPGSGHYQAISTLRVSAIRAAETELNNAEEALNLTILRMGSANENLARHLEAGALTIEDNAFLVGDALDEIPQAVGATINALSLKTTEIATTPIDLGNNRIEFGEFGEAVTVFGMWGEAIHTASVSAALGIKTSEQTLAIQKQLYQAQRLGNAVLADRVTIDKELITLNEQLANQDLSAEGRAAVLARIAELEDKLLELPELQLQALNTFIDAGEQIVLEHDAQVLSAFNETVNRIKNTPIDLSDTRIEFGEYAELAHAFIDVEAVATNLRIALERGVSIQDAAVETQLKLNDAIRDAAAIEQEQTRYINEIARLQDQINQRGLTGDALSQINEQIDTYEGYIDRLQQLMSATVNSAVEASQELANTTLDTEVLIHPLQMLAEDFISGIAGTFEHAIATGNFDTLGDALVGAIQASFARAITEKLAGLLQNLLADTIFSSIGSGGGGGGLFSGLLSFQSGGIVPGQQGQTVPILAHAGEVVLNRQQQQALLNGGMQGGNSTVNVTMQVTGNVDNATRRAVLGMANELTDIVQAGLNERRAFA